MKRSTERILVTHAGNLPRSEELARLLTAKNEGHAYDKEAFAALVQSAVTDVVKKQVDCGIDIVNDGEVGKSNFSRYTRERLSGFVERQPRPGYKPAPIFGRDLAEFPEYFNRGGRTAVGGHARLFFCNEPLKYVGQAAVRTEIEHLKAALQGLHVEEAFLPAVAPGTLEHWMKNDYYPNDEAYLYAIADAMHDEYKAIVDAGFILQIDDPDLADAWQMNSHMSVAEYRKYAELRIHALNHALRDIPPEGVRFHMCWGSYHGPHKYDIPLKDIVDLILKVRAGAYSIEASNPRHEHEWRVWEEVRLPEGKALIPGVAGHASDFIEHPELIAERLLRYARLVGRENVIAGTDCGLGARLGHPKIAWAKFETMAEGARLATKKLWGR
ncbi:MAG: cobalamin-independent methionine synthase II family protein [Deltaproteobacteria bacterium]|nr:cobalamin-independent methionine synthase II family protein [Deltaproteobacteria bacterium]